MLFPLPPSWKLYSHFPHVILLFISVIHHQSHFLNPLSFSRVQHLPLIPLLGPLEIGPLFLSARHLEITLIEVFKAVYLTQTLYFLFKIINIDPYYIRVLKRFKYGMAPSVVQGKIFALYLGIFMILSLKSIFFTRTVQLRKAFSYKNKFTKACG